MSGLPPSCTSNKKKPWRYRWPDDIRDEVLERRRSTFRGHRPAIGAPEGLNSKARGWQRGAQRRDASPGSGASQEMSVTSIGGALLAERVSGHWTHEGELQGLDETRAHRDPAQAYPRSPAHSDLPTVRTASVVTA